MGTNCNVTVIGGGAAGILAALAAKQNGNSVVILERNPSLGRKISATGNGRCNFTNTDSGNASHYYGGDKAFIENILKLFPLDKILELFDEIGATPNLEEDGKYFPLSGQAASVSELFTRYLIQNGVEIVYETKVTDIITSGKSIRIITNKGDFISDKLIIATGGMAAPDSGSDGIGYALAKRLGHSVTKLLPVIVQLKTKGGFYKRLSGIRINGNILLEINGRVTDKASGDVMFFDYGLSGSAVFKVSPGAAYALSDGKKVFVSIDTVPGYDNESLFEYLTKRCRRSVCSTEEMLVGFMNKKLISLMLEAANIKPDKAADALSADEVKRLATVLKSYRAEVTGTKEWENAQATAGGVVLSEIDQNTLQSKKDRRVAFCGEVLDVCGDCGGYNLTWAWASGYVAGRNI